MMFTSFLIELELFILVHSMIPFNTQTNPNRNTLSSIFDDPDISTPVRIYKDSLSSSNLTKLLNTFCEELDDIFKTFMDSLITRIVKKILDMGINIIFDDIYESIVPINDYNHSKSDIKYDHIYINWKAKLSKNIKKNFNIRDSIPLINNSIEETLKRLSLDNTTYIAEGTGFFSFLFLKSKANTKFFGSCITFSMFKMYIMSRLHTHAKNMHLVLQWQHLGDKRPYPEYNHTYWDKTQTSINNHVSHWATKYTLAKNTKIIECRTGPPDMMTTVETINFATDKKRIFKALIYPLLDSYNAYIKINANKPSVKKNASTFNAIKLFINDRYQLIENLLAKYP
jgi:hypothetical protein